MKVVSVTYSLTSVINIGNFENVQPNFGITVEVEDGDDSDKVKAFAKRKVVEWMNENYDELQEELKQLKGNG